LPKTCVHMLYSYSRASSSSALDKMPKAANNPVKIDPEVTGNMFPCITLSAGER
jgi:hypothetical protein